MFVISKPFPTKEVIELRQAWTLDDKAFRGLNLKVMKKTKIQTKQNIKFV